MKIISHEEFSAVDVRAGTILRAERFLKAKKPAYQTWVDFGPEPGIKQTSAQITVHYVPENLIGKQVAGVINLGTKNIAGFISEFLLLGFPDENDAICLVTIDMKVPNGKKMF